MPLEGFDDLITRASRKGLIDEASAREILRGRPPTPELLVGSGILTHEQLDGLLDESTAVQITQPANTTRFILHPEVAEAAQDPRNRFGHYIRIRELGEGAFGTVYLAWDMVLRRRVALKILKSHDAEVITRFKREARTAAALSHPNIATVYEVGEVGEQHFIALQYIQGQTLARLRLTPKEALEAIRDSARAVAYAHVQGVVHRDLKPQNMMRGEDGRVYVLDFGLARLTEPGSSLTMSGNIIGTPAYMSPEQAIGARIDERSDVYGLGATLYELVTGKRPFVGGTAVEVMRQVLDREPLAPRRVNRDLDRDVETIVQKAMEKNPARRYASANELADDLDRCCAGEAIQARPASWVYRLQKNVKKNHWLYGVGALGAAGVVLATAILLPMWRSEKSKTEARRLVDAIHRRIERAKASSLYAKGASLEVLEEQRSRALEELARMEPEFPPIPELPTLRGDILSLDMMVLQSAERFDSAMAAYDQALQIDPSYVMANLGRGLLGLRRYLYDLSVSHSTFGVLREEMALREPLRRLAIEDLRVAVERRAGDEWMVRLAEAGSALAAGDLEGAERLTTEALMENKREEFYFVRANVRLATYHYRLALNDTAAAIKIRPNYPEALYLQAQLAWMSQRFKITERSLRDARRLAPDHPFGFALQVLWEFVHGRTDRVPPLLDRMVELAPERGLAGC